MQGRAVPLIVGVTLLLAGCADHTWCVWWLADAEGNRVGGTVVTPFCGKPTPNYGLVVVCQKAKKVGHRYEPIELPRACTEPSRVD